MKQHHSSGAFPNSSLMLLDIDAVQCAHVRRCEVTGVNGW